MLVSVIMNTVNEKPDLLKMAIESYLNQIDVDVELIISTVEGDPNLDLIRELGVTKIIQTPRINHPINDGIKSPVGSYIQLNNALPYCTGDFFCFASGNDTALPNKLKIESEFARRYGAGVVYSAFDVVTPENEKKRTQGFHEYDYFKHLDGNFVSDCALVDMRLIRKYGPFDLSMKNYAFWDLWLRIYEGEGNVFCYQSRPTWRYRQNVDDMHAVRRRTPEQIREAIEDKKIMLNKHRK